MLLLQAPPTFDPDIAREFGTGGGVSDINFLGVPLFDASSLWTLLFRFVLNFLVCWIIIRLFYYKKSQRRDYYFTFMMFAVVIFLIITLMDNMKMNVAYALGLFAIFGMIRYRTETLRIREMTYLFVVMGLSIINGQALTTSYIELLITNLLVILAIWAFEGNKHSKQLNEKVILYDKIDLVKRDREDDLKADLEARTGIKIEKMEVGHIDYLRDAAFIKIWYKPRPGESNTIGTYTKLKEF
ncbi:MAG: DUF4956 domain-containing protein [Bacteroidales bacterium]|jgi:hypothetical protein|nr:DUF4956 domain-containing protein [Bacteroidales bacterium]MBQ5958768.1 DUF4956 domain-containing protein [Bacteroidales bacterium]